MRERPETAPVGRFRLGMIGTCAIIGVLSVFAAHVPTALAETRTVRVGIYQNEPKVFTATQDGDKPAGIFVDLLEAVAAEEGWDLIWVQGSWEEGLARLEAGDLDLMPDVAYSAGRDELMDFHATQVVDSWSCVYSARGTGLDDISQLDGKRVAVLKGSIQETVFTQTVNGFGYDITIIPAASLADAFQLASDGGADAAIANYLFGDYFYHEYGLTKTPIVFNAVPLYYATRQGENADLLQTIDDHLRKWVGEPGSPYYEILGHYTTKEPKALVPVWVPWVVGTALALLASAVAGILTLRWQVGARTRHLAQAVESTAKAEETLRLALDAAEEGVFDWHLKTGEVTWSPRNFIMLGYSPEEFPVDIKAWEELIHPDERERVVAEELREVETGDRSFRVEYRLRNSAGEWQWTESHGKAIAVDTDGTVERIMGTNKDITNRKRAEAELSTYRDHLQELVEERTIELADANRRLRRATDAKSAFLATMSHELRTPLNSIVGFSGLLQQGLAGDLNEEQTKQIGMIHDSGTQLLELINDILDLSKVEAGAIDIRPQATDPIEIIRRVTQTVLPLATEKGLTLEVDTPVQSMTIVSDEDRLRQILLNIVGNAVKFTAEGGVHVGFECVGDAAVAFSISDTGPGIPAEELPFIFDEFHQVEQMDTASKGTGLGLTISQRLAHLLGGEISATSVEGEGATFTLVLPIECSA